VGYLEPDFSFDFFKGKPKDLSGNFLHQNIAYLSGYL